MKTLEQQLDDEKKVNQAIVDLLDIALQKVGYSDDVIEGLTIAGKIDFLVRAANVPAKQAGRTIRNDIERVKHGR